MLSISNPIRAGNGEYYLSLAATDDYYLGDKEAPGFWAGEGATFFGLSGNVDPEIFRHLLRGFSPDGKEALVKNAASSSTRRAGWDACFSLPKSVSTAWSQGSPEIRSKIEGSIRLALERALKEIERVGIVSRTGEKGIFREEAKLTFAVFPHCTSRAGEPQLHFHAVMLNIGVRADGSTGTLEPKALFQNKMLLGALFRVEAAFQLEAQLGLRSVREGRSFELLGVSRELMGEFSTRRNEVLEELKKLGLVGAKAAAVAALNTRTQKEPLSRDELFHRWHQMGEKHHWTQKHLEMLLAVRCPERDVQAEKKELRTQVFPELTDSKSFFSERDLLTTTLQAAQGLGLSADQALEIGNKLLLSPELVPVGTILGEEKYTTREIIRLEKQVLLLAKSMALQQKTIPPSPPLPQTDFPLSQEQIQAVQNITRTPGLSLLRGIAGAGKTTVFKVANQVWKENGYEVIGTALSGKAAQELKSASAIPAQTLHSLLWELQHERRFLTPKSVLVIDEAAMVGTRQLAAVLKACALAQATCVLAGDDRQLQAIEHGGGFSALLQHFPSSELREIHRQKATWIKEAIGQFAMGYPRAALAAYAERGFVSENASEPEALARVIFDWKKHGGSENPREHVILAPTNAIVDELNALAQQQRLQSGFLKPEFVELGGKRFFVGDRVICTRNNRKLGVWNGDTGSIQHVGANGITLVLDANHSKPLEINTRTYTHLTHAYVLTLNRAQGSTVENSMVFASQQDREKAYVSASRARNNTHWFIPSSLESLSATLNVSKKKEFVTELVFEMKLS